MIVDLFYIIMMTYKDFQKKTLIIFVAYALYGYMSETTEYLPPNFFGNTQFQHCPNFMCMCRGDGKVIYYIYLQIH